MIYVETLIRGSIEDVWRLTQEPDQHQRWDLRFTRIEHLPGEAGGPQGFRYAFVPLPGLALHGVGISVGERHRPDGSRTSALRFSSRHRLSPIRSGAGYWRYIPTSDGVRFLTGYRYRGFGPLKPAMGWATAWSFDRLRLWVETGRSPKRLLLHSVGELAIRLLAVTLTLLTGPPALTITVGALALFLPPLPSTPAARRCARRAADRLTSGPPSTLTHLEHP